MHPEMFIASTLLLVGVKPINLPSYWYPDRDNNMWIRNNHNPSAPTVFVLPGASGGLMSRPSDAALTPGNFDNSITCHCDQWLDAKHGCHYGNSEPAYAGHGPFQDATTSGAPFWNTPRRLCDDRSWKHQFANCCDFSQVKDLYVFDTDGTADDAMALSMILNWTSSNPMKILAGITLVKGSVSVRQVARNVMKTLKINNREEVPVYSGADSRLADPVPFLVGTSSPYGNDTFGDFCFFPEVDDNKVCDVHPAVFISRLVHENPDKVTILCAGSLTNIALASHIMPEFYERVKEILYYGGTDGSKPLLEGISEPTNDDLDPDASRLVFNWPVHPSNPPRIATIPSPLPMPQGWRNITLGQKGTTVVKFLNHAEKYVLSNPNWMCAAPLIACAAIDRTCIQSRTTGQCLVLTNRTSGSPTMQFTLSANNTSNNVILVVGINIRKVQAMLLNHL